MSFQKSIDRKLGLMIGDDFLERTKHLYRRAEIAGSLRRMEPIVHDVDIAVIQSEVLYSLWTNKLRQRVSEIGGRIVTLGEVICNLRYRDVQINLFLCMSEEYWGFFPCGRLDPSVTP